jgi:hypothetical protein
MAPHTLEALCGGYVRYLSQRTKLTAEQIQDRYFCETGGLHPERDWHAFRKWAGRKVYVMDQLGHYPFGGEAA